MSELTLEECECVFRICVSLIYTLLVTFNFFPWPTYGDFATAASRRARVLLSNACITIIVSFSFPGEDFREGKTDSCASNSQLDLSSSSTHQLAELLANALQETQSVVVGEGGQKVLDCVVLVRAPGVLLQLGHDLGLVFGTESWGIQDGRQLGIFGVYVVQGTDCFCDGIEGGTLHGCRVLFSLRVSHVLAATTSK